jgi:ATP-dependent Clp protease ATP-binding subunit ClpA
LALASVQRHEYATPEHLLLALLDDADARVALRACQADLEGLRTSQTGFVERLSGGRIDLMESMTEDAARDWAGSLDCRAALAGRARRLDRQRRAPGLAVPD